MYELTSGNMRNIASASKRAEDCFACRRAAQPTRRYCLLFADTVYTVSVFALFCLLAEAAVAVAVYYLQMRVTIVIYAVLILRLLAAWLAYYPNNITSA